MEVRVIRLPISANFDQKFYDRISRIVHSLNFAKKYHILADIYGPTRSPKILILRIGLL